MDNNAFVNMGATVALREATLLAPPLGHAADPHWEGLAKSMFLRIDRNGVIRNPIGIGRARSRVRRRRQQLGCFR